MSVKGTRVRVGLMGQDAGFQLIRVDLEAEDAAIRDELISKAAAKLGVSLPEDGSIVTAFLADGAPVDEMSLLEKDDTVWHSMGATRRLSWRRTTTARTSGGCGLDPVPVQA